MSAKADTTETRLSDVLGKIAASAKAAGRSVADVNLVAVSKTFDAPDIEPAIKAGHKLFGENRVQEAMGKWPALKEQYPDVRLHLIGPLQTNKAHDAVRLFDCIETVDRPKLARILAKEITAQGRVLPVFVQVNTGAEPQKAGVLPEDADEFIRLCREECCLDVVGLMCIPPVGEEPSLHFALLEKIAQRNGIAGLSMGMSADYEIAVAFGATHVRVGSAIFGTRAAPG